MISVSLLLVLAILLFGIARRSMPASNATGQTFTGNHPTVAGGNVLRVASFNIQTGKSDQGKRDILRAAQAIAQVDVAGVQEVYGRSWLNRMGIGKSQSEALADIGQFNFCFNPTRRRWFIDHRGNALFSRLPIQHWQSTMLPDQTNKSFRNYTTVQLEWNQQAFVLINTHLHTSVGRDEQLKAVIEEFDKYPRVILMGDFNTRRDSKTLATLLARNDVEDAIATQNLDPDESNRIDWIITRGFNVVDGVFLPKGISDHPYYEVHLSFDKT